MARQPAAAATACETKTGASRQKQAQAHRVKRVRRALRSATALVKSASTAAILPTRLRARGVSVPKTSAGQPSTAPAKLDRAARDQSSGRAAQHAVSPPAPEAKVVQPPKPRPPHKDKPFRKAGLFAGDHPHRLPLSEHPLILNALNIRRKTPSRKSVDGGRPAPVRSDETYLPSEFAKQFPPLPYSWKADDQFPEEDFALPFDILHDWEQGELGTTKTPQKYVKVKKNIHVDRKPHLDPEISAICHCEPSSGCGEHCLNRAMSFTCGKNCPCGEGCTNQSLSRRQTAPYKIVWTGKRGFGLSAAAPIKKGDFIMDYRGEVIEMNTYYARIRTVYQGRKDFYALAYDTDEVIDAGLKGNDARFMNHSCGPNLQVRKLQTMGQGSEEFEVGFWAERDIAVGEELFYNYNFDSFTTIVRPPSHPDFTEEPVERRQKCFCGAATCSGWLGKKADKIEEDIKPILSGLKPSRTKVKKAKRIRVAKANAASTVPLRARKSSSKLVSRSTVRAVSAVKKARLQPAGNSPTRRRKTKIGRFDGSNLQAVTTAKASGGIPERKAGKAKAGPAVLASILAVATQPESGLAVQTRRRAPRKSAARPHNLDILPAVVSAGMYAGNPDIADKKPSLQMNAPRISISGCSSACDSRDGTPSLTTGPSGSSVAPDELIFSLDDERVFEASGAALDANVTRLMQEAAGPCPSRTRDSLSAGKGEAPGRNHPEGFGILTAIAAGGAARRTNFIVATAHVTLSLSRTWPTPDISVSNKPMRFTLEEIFGLSQKIPQNEAGHQQVKHPASTAARLKFTNPTVTSEAPKDSEQTPAGDSSGPDQRGGPGNVYQPHDANPGAAQPGEGSGQAAPGGDLGFAGAPGDDDHDDEDGRNNGGDGQDDAGEDPASSDDESSGRETENEATLQDLQFDQPPSPTAILNSALQMSNGGYVPEDLTLDSLSRRPDLAALTAQGLQLPDFVGELEGLTDVPAKKKKRKGKSRQAQAEELDPEAIAQRMVDEVARTAARAEKRRMRQEAAESSAKKRRNKWHLPLETEQLEIERKKKKKGQKWMEAMKTLVEQKRAEAGLPVAETSSVRQESTDVQDHIEGQNNPQDSSAHAASEDEHDERSVNGAETASTLSENTRAEEIEVDVSNGTAANMAEPAPKPKPKRIRKPRPPRRFKTTLTRLRPKLEAALSSVSVEEEEAALERERKRRKKGTPWLEAMKALARAKREAAEAAEQGLPPPDFVLPPTSFPPNGRKRSKKSRQPGDEHDPENSDEEHSMPLVDTQAEVAALMPPGRQPILDEPLETDITVGIPAFMFPPDHPAAQAHRREGGPSNETVELPDYLDPHIMADATAAAEAFNDRSQDVPGPSGEAAANTFPEYASQFQGGDGAHVQAEYPAASGSNAAAQYVQPEYRFDEHTAQYAEHAFQQPQAANMDGNAVTDYQQTYGGLPMPPATFNLPNFDAFSGQHTQGVAVNPAIPQLPPVPTVYKPSETDSPQKANGEKRKRGPPVKKIAGATLEPLTDEQWEAERKKRKKGFNWVAETKAAAAAEREQLNLARSGIKLPRKPKGQRAAASALAAATVAVAEEGSQDQSQAYANEAEQHQDLPFSALDLQSLQAMPHSATPGHEVPPVQDDVLPYPTMPPSLLQDQPYSTLHPGFDGASGHGYGLDMYNPTDDVEGYGAAATADQIYNAMHPYRNDGE